MNESEPNKLAGVVEQPEETFDQRKHRFAREAHETTEALTAAIVAHAAALKRHHWTEGWDAGFSQGWQAATRFAHEKFEQEHAAARAVMPEPKPELYAPSLIPSANDLVLQFITEVPGRRGVEIADNFSQTIFKLPERTVRTALHRLKKAEKIKIVDGRWYASEAAPTDPQRRLGE